jgi:hypothetical protein
MKKNIVSVVIILLIIIAAVPLTAHWLPSIEQVEPEGRIIFTARSTGPCAACWHAELNETLLPFPDSYVEPGIGFIINFGTTKYYNLSDNFLINYLIENTTVEQLWDVKEITLMSINWQHDEVKQSLRVVCKPFKETTGTFLTNPKTYGLGIVPTFDPKNYSSNCMTFSGSYRNGTKIEKVSGYALMIVGLPPNASSNSSIRAIILALYQNRDGGEIEPFFVACWVKDDWNINGTIIEKANTFHYNFWTL